MRTLKLLCIALPFFMLSICVGQTSSGRDTATTPDIRVKVNKQYDSKGNVISYDSSYTYSYSDFGNKSFNIDTLYNQFRTAIGFNIPNFLSQPFDNNSFNDLSMDFNPFNSDFFRNKAGLDTLALKNLFEQMDSLSGKLFQNNYH